MLDRVLFADDNDELVAPQRSPSPHRLQEEEPKELQEGEIGQARDRTVAKSVVEVEAEAEVEVDIDSSLSCSDVESDSDAEPQTR